LQTKLSEKDADEKMGVEDRIAMLTAELEELKNIQIKSAAAQQEDEDRPPYSK
jgi:hypothetical protein